MAGRRLLGYFPQLERRAWEDVAPELSRFLRRLFDSENAGIPSGFLNLTPTTIEADGVSSPGSEVNGWAAADHDHPVGISSAVGLGNSNAPGASSLLNRADHIHKRDVRFRLNDADVAIRNAPNFLDADLEWTLTDDVGNDEVEISGKLSDVSRTFTHGGTVKGASGASDCIVWEAPFAATVLNVRAVRLNGGTGATVNARRNYVDEHLAGDLSLPTLGVTEDGGAVQNTAYVADDILEARVKSTAGSPSDITIIIRLRRT